MLQALPVSLTISHLLLIDLLKERPSLWDMLDSKYTKHEVVK